MSQVTKGDCVLIALSIIQCSSVRSDPYGIAIPSSPALNVTETVEPSPIRARRTILVSLVGLYGSPHRTMACAI